MNADALLTRVAVALHGVTPPDPEGALALHRDAAARVVAALGVETRRETCREETDDVERWRCGEPADFILWGRLFPSEALGPRCYDHAVKHTSFWMPGRVDQWAVYDIRSTLTTEPTP